MPALIAALVLILGTPHIDPAAMALLARMSATLSGAKSLVVTAHIEREQVDADGQILDFYTTMQAALKRPHDLYTATAGDVQPYATWYDGSMLTVYVPDSKTLGRRYHRTEAGSSPLTPFLSSDPYTALRREVTTARIVGNVRAGDILCRQLAFTGPDIDWQLWITIDDDNPLPARMAAIYKHRAGRPRLVVQFDRWDLDVPLDPATFRAKIPRAQFYR